MKLNLLSVFVLLTCSVSAQIPNTIKPADKIYGLSKFWQEVNYNFIYLNKIDRVAWDKKYLELIESVPNTKNDYEYYRELQKFCALLHDGHTNVYFPKGIVQMNTMFGDFRLFLENIEGKAIVVRTNFSKKDEIPVGSEIIEVNGKPTQTFIKESVEPYISSSTDYVLEDNCISRLLQGLSGESFKLKILKPNKQILNLTLTHKKTLEEKVYPDWENIGLLDFKWLDNKIAYLGLNSFEDPKIDTLFIEKLPELYKAKAIIIDLRNNGGGNSNIGRDILQYLTKDSFLLGSKNKSRLHIPSHKAWGRFTESKDTFDNEFSKQSYLTYKDSFYYHFPYEKDTIKIKENRIIVPTAVLIGHNTASAAEDFLIYADNQKHFTKIGENSYGSTGQPMFLDLPGNGRARICTKQDTYPDGREFVGYGVKPDIEVKKTLSDFINKKDPVLNKAVQFLVTKIK